jgi:hypothetical protein
MAFDMDTVNGLFPEGIRELVDAVEPLRRLGLGQSLGQNSPRIVVCGNRSTGKSSVLEALTGIPFPVGNGLDDKCTSFPIEGKQMSFVIYIRAFACIQTQCHGYMPTWSASVAWYAAMCP